MPLPVSDIGDQIIIRLFRTAKKPIDGSDENLDQIDVPPLVESPMLYVWATSPLWKIRSIALA